MDRELETLEKAGTWRTVSHGPSARTPLGPNGLLGSSARRMGPLTSTRPVSCAKLHPDPRHRSDLHAATSGVRGGAVGLGHHQAAAQVPVWGLMQGLDGNGMLLLCHVLSAVGTVSRVRGCVGVWRWRPGERRPELPSITRDRCHCRAQVRCPMQRTPRIHLPYIHMLRSFFAALLRAHLPYISLPIVAYCSACLWGL